MLSWFIILLSLTEELIHWQKLMNHFLSGNFFGGIEHVAYALAFTRRELRLVGRGRARRPAAADAFVDGLVDREALLGRHVGERRGRVCDRRDGGGEEAARRRGRPPRAEPHAPEALALRELGAQPVLRGARRRLRRAHRHRQRPRQQGPVALPGAQLTASSISNVWIEQIEFTQY